MAWPWFHGKPPCLCRRQRLLTFCITKIHLTMANWYHKIIWYLSMNGCFKNKMMFAMSMPTCVSAKFAAYNQVLAGRPQCVPLRLPVPVSTSLKNSYKKPRENYRKLDFNHHFSIFFSKKKWISAIFLPFRLHSSQLRLQQLQASLEVAEARAVAAAPRGFGQGGAAGPGLWKEKTISKRYWLEKPIYLIW